MQPPLGDAADGIAVGRLTAMRPLPAETLGARVRLSEDNASELRVLGNLEVVPEREMVDALHAGLGQPGATFL